MIFDHLLTLSKVKPTQTESAAWLAGGQMPLDLRPDKQQSFESFDGGVNSLTVSMLKQMALGEGEPQIYLWGASGSGKSHLLQACCDWRVRHGGEAMLVSMSSAGAAAVLDSDRLFDCEFVCLDEIELVAAKTQLEQLLFNLINGLRASGARLVIAGQLPPLQLGVALPDLLSRLSWGPVLRIDPISDEALMARLRSRADAFGMRLSEEVARYIIRRCPRDLVALEALLERLHRQSLVERRALTLRYVSQVISRTTSD